jgi:curli biogenesis system outer membrane secretion channel CsgG
MKIRPHFFSVFPILGALTLGSCATTSPPMVHEGPTMAAPAPQPQALGLKRKVAVLRFSNETLYGGGVFGNKTKAIEKQAEDILKARLVDSGAVLLIESDLVDPKADELASLGADYAVVGSISEFGRRVTSDTGVFSRTKKQQAYAAVNLRIVDTRTGQAIYAEEGRGEADIETGRVLGVGSNASYDSSINDKAISAAIGKLVGNILQNLGDRPWQTFILEESDGQVLISGGKLQGLKQGDHLKVIQQGKLVQNRQQGGMIRLPGTPLGLVEVVDFFGSGVSGEGSVCTWVEGSSSGHPLDTLIVEEKK